MVSRDTVRFGISRKILGMKFRERKRQEDQLEAAIVVQGRGDNDWRGGRMMKPWMH